MDYSGFTNNLKNRLDYGPWGQQFTPPFCYELAGRDLDIRFDDNSARAVFQDEKHMLWKRSKKESATDYWALKLCNDIYLACFGIEPENCITLIIDLGTGLVTLDEVSFSNDRVPRRTALDFGWIAVQGQPMPKHRHALTKELAGNCFKWVFCDTYWHIEGYKEDSMFYCSNYPEFKGVGPYTAVKISETVYYTCNGDNVESISELMDLSRMVSVSRSIVGGKGGKAIPLGAVGEYVDDLSGYSLPE